MSSIRNVCVYCGSGAGNDPRFAEAAEAFGRILAAEGIGLVYGGGGNGLMGKLARATLAGGGYVTGIIPNFLVRKEHALTSAQEMLVVEDMHERKQAMFERADAFIALPGGIGTLEELVEIMTWAQLDRHAKPILLANLNGFWRPLLSLFAHMRNEGFIREGLELRYLVAEKIEDIVPMLRAAEGRRATERAPEEAVSPRNM
ncbi:MAG TPA: TIGR00730 family Rossman fold protein [Roseiarcus sp.]|nr:TIGR00730 family Rossman fold protein [Roseiarcus sp.]